MTLSLRHKVDSKKSFGIAFSLFGMLMFISPGLQELGLGVSAVGVAFYAASKGRTPAWSVFSFVPFLGTLVILVMLAFLPPKDQAATGILSLGRRLLLHPLTWAIPLFLGTMVYFINHNPSFTMYRTRSYNSLAKNELMITVAAQEAYHKDHHRYSDSIDTLVGDTYSLSLSPDVTAQVISADEHNYKMEAYHKDGNSKFLISGPAPKIEKVSKYK